MKRFVPDFIRRGLIACGFGPLVLATFYLILQQRAVIDTLSVSEVCTGIFSLSALAFIAGGMNAIYQIERLPLLTAILIHGSVLYISYLVTYLLNGWLKEGWLPLLVFSGVFVLGYLIIWAIIYSVIRRNTNQINRMLQIRQQAGNDLQK